jgi:hypothetical protein
MQARISLARKPSNPHGRPYSYRMCLLWLLALTLASAARAAGPNTELLAFTTPDEAMPVVRAYRSAGAASVTVFSVTRVLMGPVHPSTVLLVQHKGQRPEVAHAAPLLQIRGVPHALPGVEQQDTATTDFDVYTLITLRLSRQATLHQCVAQMTDLIGTAQRYGAIALDTYEVTEEPVGVPDARVVAILGWPNMISVLRFGSALQSPFGHEAAVKGRPAHRIDQNNAVIIQASRQH